MIASQQLRARTQACHDAVDAAFGTADLSDLANYARMLGAHARALLPAEAALASWTALPARSPRTEAIAADLAQLGVPMPSPLPFALADERHAWGALYVLEGSRLGNAMLERQVAPGLPRAYMAARHGQGGWRALLAAIDARAAGEGGDWLDGAVAGAEAAFALYLAAARAEALAGLVLDRAGQDDPEAGHVVRLLDLAP